MKKERQSIARIVYTILSFVVVTALLCLLTVFLYRTFFHNIRSPEQFRDYIKSFGFVGRFVLLGLQILQVFIALIPGEVIEIGAGYSFGWFEGTLLCYVGIAIASALVFLLVKRFGIKLVRTFLPEKDINNLRFINSEKRLGRTLFLLYFIPGTPKDALTYFFGLTRIPIGDFLWITMIARIPSLISSTIGGHYISGGNYKAAIIIFLITALISLFGYLGYNRYATRKKAKE